MWTLRTQRNICSFSFSLPLSLGVNRPLPGKALYEYIVVRLTISYFSEKADGVKRLIEVLHRSRYTHFKTSSRKKLL